MVPDAHANEIVELVITEERSQGRYLVTIGGQAVRLSYGQHQLLLELVKRKLQRSSRGYLESSTLAYPAAVYRLRKSIDLALGPGKGKEVVETGVGAEYRLASFVEVSTEVGEAPKNGGGPGDLRKEQFAAA